MRILLTSTAAAAILALSGCGSESPEPDAATAETYAADMDPALPAEGDPGATGSPVPNVAQTGSATMRGPGTGMPTPEVTATGP